MATKLEKAQYRYEALLRDLGEKAEMVGELERAGPGVLKSYRRAKDNLSDRKLELEFLESEIEGLQAEQGQADEQAEARYEEVKAEIADLEELVEIKYGKSNPIKKKLAGAQYDFKFVERSLTDEQNKVKEKKRREEMKAARDHEENVKKIKIEILKRRKAIMDMKREIKELEGPAKKMEKELEQLKAEADELAQRLESDRKENDQSDLLAELERQKEAKKKEVQRAAQHLKDVLADVGEDLYERRKNHPVLNKYYADLDAVAETIDKLQGQAG
jgi:chromosome segregation ATPase